MRFVHHPAKLWTFLLLTCLIVTAACTTLRPVAWKWRTTSTGSRTWPVRGPAQQASTPWSFRSGHR